MSFTSEVKDEMSRVVPTCEYCRRAMLSALVRVEGTLAFSGQGHYRLEMTTETASVARTIIKLLHEVELKTELTMRQSVLHKARNYLIAVPHQPNLPQVLTSLGIMNNQGIVQEIDQALIVNDCCAAAYLRGAFLGGGFIADPRGDFHFELATQNETLANELIALLGRFGILARVNHRRNLYIVYLKGGEKITSFLGVVGAHRSVLAIENVRVVKSIRNDVNRQINAEMANHRKMSKAALDQIDAINKLAEAGKLETLPPALYDFAKLRLANPDVSARELGEMATPPLSKSAVFHRIRRIEELAARL